MMRQGMSKPCPKACLRITDQTCLRGQAMSEIGKPDMAWT